VEVGERLVDLRTLAKNSPAALNPLALDRVTSEDVCLHDFRNVHALIKNTLARYYLQSAVSESSQ
jgi:hypothetical protein